MRLFICMFLILTVPRVLPNRLELPDILFNILYAGLVLAFFQDVKELIKK